MSSSSSSSISSINDKPILGTLSNILNVSLKPSMSSSGILTEYFSPGVIWAEQVLQPRHLLHAVFCQQQQQITKTTTTSITRLSRQSRQHHLNFRFGRCPHALLVIAHGTRGISGGHCQVSHHQMLWSGSWLLLTDHPGLQNVRSVRNFYRKQHEDLHFWRSSIKLLMVTLFNYANSELVE